MLLNSLYPATEIMRARKDDNYAICYASASGVTVSTDTLGLDAISSTTLKG